MRKFALSWVWILFALSSCKKEDDIAQNFAGFYYEETYCADPWEQNGSYSDAELHALVADYLTNSLVVEFSNLLITNEGIPEACLACSCKTGRIIRIEAAMAYKEILVEKGFKKE